MRLVLQTGATALTAALFATAFAYGAVFAALIVFATVFIADAPPQQRLLVLVPIAFTGVAVFSLRWAWRSRASDVFVDDEGIRVEGGPDGDRRWPWAAIDVDRSRLVEDPNARVTINGHDTYRRAFVLGLRDGTEAEIGSSYDDVEQASFEALLATLRARTAPPPEAPTAVDGLVRCASCGAPAAPRVEAAACWRCGSPVETPPRLRDKVAAATALADGRRAAEARVRAWLEQPAAADVNRWLAAVFAVRYGLPLLLCLGPSQWMAILVGAWTIGKIAWLRITDRFAYRSLVLDWAARPAVAPGGPPACRGCGAPLAPRGDDVITRCASCDADNVLGVDLARAAATVAVARVDIERFIADQAERRSWPRLQVLGGLIATVALSLWAAIG